jgi:hypothetical protein
MKTIVVRVGVVLSIATAGACSSKGVDVGGAGPSVPPPSSVYSTSTPTPVGFGESTSHWFAVDATRAFFTERSALLGCTLSDCSGTVTRYPMRPPPGEDAFALGGSMVVDDGFIYLTDVLRILRVAKEGSDTFEVLARDVQASQLVAYEESIFWTDSVVLGRVFSCPKTGCDGHPRILVDGLTTLTALAVDDRYVYFVEAPADDTRNAMTPGGSSVISRCPVTGCETPETLVGADEGVTGPIVVDDDFLYFMGQKCSRDDEDPTGGLEPCSYLAAMRK